MEGNYLQTHISRMAMIDGAIAPSIVEREQCKCSHELHETITIYFCSYDDGAARYIANPNIYMNALRPELVRAVPCIAFISTLYRITVCQPRASESNCQKSEEIKFISFEQPTAKTIPVRIIIIR